MIKRKQLAAWLAVVLFLGSALTMVALICQAVAAMEQPATASHGSQQPPPARER